LGTSAGYSNTDGNCNSFLGSLAGYSNTNGDNNTFLGYFTGFFSTTGNDNTFLGMYSGFNNIGGSVNTFVGKFSGYGSKSGYANTYLGSNTGYNNETGDYNVFIGYNAGYNETGSNRLYIANSNASFPLVYGEFDNAILAVNGKLGIGRQNPTYPIHMGSGAYCSVGGTWTNASSRSLKENIESLSTGEALDALTKLNPVKYNYKVDKTDKHVGFIAEDVPDLVAASDRKGLSPMDVTAVLTKVVQEQQNMIQEQQKVNQEYKRIISELQERIANLEKK
jgi:hypothetical protein